MAATSTFKDVLNQLCDETDIGYVLSGLTGTTTTLTKTTGDLEMPSTGSLFPINSKVIITAGGTPGDISAVAGYNPITGVITLNPAITTGATDAIVLDPAIDRPNRILQAVNRAFNNRLVRWQRNPLTFVPDGDLQGTTVTDFWTGTAATPTYVTPTFPAGSAAAAFGFVGFERVLQSVTSNATNRVTSNLIDIAANASTSAYQWRFQTAIRVVTGSGNAQIRVWDETNNAEITVNVIVGDQQTQVTTSLGFINIEGTLNIPTTCKQISFRLISSATATTIQMTPLVAFPANAVSFPIPNRIIAANYIGNFHYAQPLSGTTGPYAMAYSEPITIGGRHHSIQNFGDHFTVTFDFMPIVPVWFDELTYDPPLSAMTDVTSFPLDYVYKWAKYELFKYLYTREKPQYRTTSYGASIPVPSQWKTKAIEAKREAEHCDYEPEIMTVLGRV